MEGRMFFIDKGAHVLARNLEGTTVSFESFEQFKRYYAGNLDLSGHYYVDYEPEKKLLYTSAKGNFEPLSNQWDGPVAEYDAVIGDVESMREKLEDPFFGLTLEEARNYKLIRLKQSTYAAITAHMPEWKQVRWKEYIALHEKVSGGNELTALEELTYEAFPGEDRKHDDCYNDCLGAFRWLMKCVAAHNAKEKEIKKARSINTIKAVKDPEYPGWVG